jgi:hypothetical protein
LTPYWDNVAMDVQLCSDPSYSPESCLTGDGICAFVYNFRNRSRRSTASSVMTSFASLLRRTPELVQLTCPTAMSIRPTKASAAQAESRTEQTQHNALRLRTNACRGASPLLPPQRRQAGSTRRLVIVSTHPASKPILLQPSTLL